MNNGNTPITISTIGDSLTEGNGQESVISEIPIYPFQYQSYLYHYLREKNICSVVRNFGVGGQIINEICSRIPKTIPAHNIVVMGGTNCVWRYADVDIGIEEEINHSMLELLEETIPYILEEQKNKFGYGPVIIVCSIPPFGNVLS